jgi:hypothetical protein
MPTVYWGEVRDGKNVVVKYNPDHEAKVGRWCKPPYVPDRCYTCWDPTTLAHYPATGYYEESNEVGIWRHGMCERCEGARANVVQIAQQKIDA